MKNVFFTFMCICCASLAYAQSSVLLEDFENFPEENFWQTDLADRTGTFFYYDANRAPLMIVDNPQQAGLNASAKVCRVQVYAGAANSGILKIEFTGGGKTGQPVLEYPACPTCTGGKYDRLRFKFYKGTLTERYVEMEPNGSPTNPKTIVATSDLDEWQYVIIELSATSYNSFQIRVNRNANGSGSAPGSADGDFIYIDDFELYNSADDASGIDPAVAAKTPVSATYYDLAGRQASASAKGLLIQKSVYDDGTVGYNKVMK
jgi:hypothetical protein